MKQTLHILLVLILSAHLGLPAHAQATEEPWLPWACSGTLEKYWVKGFNGTSYFEWTVVFNSPTGEVDVTSDVIVDFEGNYDVVHIQWPTDPEMGGVYTFRVTETTAYGCVGTEWEQDIIVNSSAINISFADVPTSFFVCIGNEAVLDPGARFIDYLWQDTDMPDPTGQFYTTTEAGTYQVRLVDTDFSCSFSSIEAGFHPLPEVDLGRDTTLFINQTLTLNAWGSGIMNWEWYSYNFRDKKWNTQPEWFQSTYPVEPGAGDQWIAVWVTDNNGCVNSDSIRVRAGDYSRFRIPSAFIPGSHIAENQRWYFPAPAEDGAEALYPYLNDVEVKIFNRWGKLVFESFGNYEPWDGRDMNGRPLPMDSYHYIIRIKISGKVYNYKGSVTIIR